MTLYEIAIQIATDDYVAQKIAEQQLAIGSEPYTVHLDYSLPPVEGGEEMSVDTSLPTEVTWRYDTVRYLKPRVIELEVER